MAENLGALLFAIADSFYCDTLPAGQYPLDLLFSLTFDQSKADNNNNVTAVISVAHQRSAPDELLTEIKTVSTITLPVDSLGDKQKLFISKKAIEQTASKDAEECKAKYGGTLPFKIPSDAEIIKDIEKGISPTQIH